MNVSFDKIDRFTELVKEAKAMLEADRYSIMGIFTMKRKPEIRESLIKIKNSNNSKEDKRKELIQYIIELWKLTDENAQRHGFENIQSLAESRLKQMFNEEAFLKESLNTFYKVAVCSSHHNLKTEKGISEFIIEIENAIGTKVNEADIIDIIQKDIPQIKDVEAEFLCNCPTPSDVETMRDFYYGRLSRHIDADSINWFHQEVNKAHPNLEELVLCGLLEKDSLRIIKNCFIMISAIMVGLCGEIIAFLNKLSPTPIQSQQISNIYLSEKKGMKINYIRVINCLYELGFFVDENQNIINKIDVMKVFGSIINKDLKDYDKDLSRALSDSTALDKNLEIFSLLKDKMNEIFNSK